MATRRRHSIGTPAHLTSSGVAYMLCHTAVKSEAPVLVSSHVYHRRAPVLDYQPPVPKRRHSLACALYCLFKDETKSVYIDLGYDGLEFTVWNARPPRYRDELERFLAEQGDDEMRRLLWVYQKEGEEEGEEEEEEEAQDSMYSVD